MGTWSDLSGNGRDATQATAAKKPTYKTGILNGRPVVRFDGTDDYLDVPDFAYTLTGLTVAVVTTGTNTQGRWPFAHYEVNGDQRSWGISHSSESLNKLKVNISADGTTTNLKNYAGSTNINTGSHIMAFIFQTDTLALCVDGATETPVKHQDSTVNSLHDSTGNLTVGAMLNTTAVNFWDADIAEVVMYDRALSAAERRRVEKYLGMKYGVVVS